MKIDLSARMPGADRGRSRWNLKDVASALGVGARRDIPGWSAEGVGIDSRTLGPGEIFVCVRGERTDGHAYLAQARAAGAAAVVIEERAALVSELDLPHPNEAVAVFVVEDGLVALQELARFHRERMQTATVFGVTGSNGKTSSKEMLAGMLAILAGEEAVAATRGNLNNHFGVPLSLLAMPAEIRYAVIEMGMNHSGEIELLSKIAVPDHALITQVAPVHVENFREPGVAGLPGIAQAKLEILAGLRPGGCLAYPADAPGQELALTGARRAGARLVRFAAPAVEASGPHGLRFAWRGHTVHAPAYHNPVMASNLVGCLEVLSAAGFADQALVAAAGQIRAQSGRRFEIISKERTDLAPQLLVDDSYNANPVSFARALEALRGLLPDGRLACFAGEMGELGPEFGPTGHREVGHRAASLGYEFLGVCGGHHAEVLRDAFAIGTAGGPARTRFATSVEELIEELPALDLAGFDGILVKGSRSAHMDRLSDVIRALQYT